MVKEAHKGTSVIKITRKLTEDNFITNSYWSAWEAGTVPLTDGLRRAVAEAFDWDNDWPENPPVAPVSSLDALRAEVAELKDLQERTLGAVLELAKRVPPAPQPSL